MSTKRRTLRFRCITYDPWPILVAGNRPHLGNWNPDAALPMRLEMETEGRREWVASLQRHNGQAFEFKFAAKADWGVLWESGANRVVTADNGSAEIAEPFRK